MMNLEDGTFDFVNDLSKRIFKQEIRLNFFPTQVSPLNMKHTNTCVNL